MEGKPLHYDGSLHGNQSDSGTNDSEPIRLTDEVRGNISGNPYTFEN